ncbi:hypothetical protein [Bosea sp. RAC05]|uniref:hypothetical protein n=1 Tax=Bosea sp. RAC05 TaxID=1842539 RepID=UPI000856954E|nr:hypothetical protein [Bosea sp. RAC05]AOG03318.1 hypothetical protein BSY19_5013 [Bosea sp. RAC05]
MKDTSILDAPLPMVPLFGTTVVTDRAAPRLPEVVAIYGQSSNLVEGLAPEAPVLDDAYEHTPDFVATPTTPAPRM